MKFGFRRAGAIQDPENKQGLANLTAGTMNEGAGDLKAEAFKAKLENNSIKLGFSSGRDHFTGRLKTLSRNRDKAFELLQLALNKPRFDRQAVNRIRRANIARIKSSRTSPQWQAARLRYDFIYGDHPYGRNSGGSLSSLHNITAEDMHKLVDRRLAKDNLVIGVSGAITPEELEKMLNTLFAKLPEKAEIGRIGATQIRNQGKLALYERDIPQSIVSISQPGIARQDADYYTALVMNQIFGAGGFGSRLMKQARQKRGLTYGIYAGLNSRLHAHSLTINTATANRHAGPLIELVREQMRKMRQDKVTEDELQNAKFYLIGSLPLNFDSTDSIAGTLMSLQLKQLPIDELLKRQTAIAKVSREDVHKMAKRLLAPETLATAIVGQPEGVEIDTTYQQLPNVE